MLHRYVIRRIFLKRSLLVLCAFTFICVIFFNYQQSDIHVRVNEVKANEVKANEVKVDEVKVDKDVVKSLRNSDKQVTEKKLVPEQKCILPTLDEKDPVMMKFFKEYPPVHCPAEPSRWVFVDNGTLRFSKEAKAKHGDFQCDCFPLIRNTDDVHITWNSATKDCKDGSPVPSDYVKIKCHSSTNQKNTFVDILFGVANNPQIEERLKAVKPPANGLGGLSVLFLGYDSMSRMAWNRRMRKTREFFLGSMNAIEMEGYNIMGDGTPAALFPILTGKHEEEMYESRKKHKGAKPVDGYPWIWKDFKEKGYITSWADAAIGIAPFNYRLLGFHDPPADYFMRPYYLGVDNIDKTERKKHAEYCRGPETKHSLWLQWPKMIMDKYMDKPKMLFHFYAVISHGDNNKITMVDTELRDFLVNLKKSGHLNNTAVVLFGDHGARYSKLRATWSGKLEERLPYMGMSFPPWFSEKYPSLIRNLRLNAHRLTTPMDIHYTLLDFLKFDGAGSGDLTKRGISLFKEVPIERECSHADVRNHWCACLSWKSASTGSEEIKKAAQASVKFINGLTSNYRQDCAELSVLNVTSAQMMTSNTDMLKFEHSVPKSEGRLPSFGKGSKDNEVFYQLSFIATPGNAHFEITLSQKNLEYNIAYRDISRINKYGDDPACILEKNRQLRQFCYCNSKIK